MKIRVSGIKHQNKINVHDYYIPQIDGQKTVDIDSTPGQQVDTDDQLLEDLRKDMISGMGIPASLTF